MSHAGLTVDGVLGPGGALSAVLPGYEHRPAQLAMARAVAAALESGHTLLAEAGTGTGKTLAYLVPAVLAGRRVVVSTATRTLQEQLMHRAVPLLRKVGLDFSASMLLGRPNYLCAHRFEQFDRAPLFETPDAAAHWPQARAWAYATETGEKDEARLPESWPVWSKVTTSSDACLGSNCPVYEGCFVTRARKAAQDCQLIIVNHALFFADAALKARGRELGLGLLPAFDAVVFDEAHALEDVATDHFGAGLSYLRCAAVADDVLELTAEHGLPTLAATAAGLKGEAERFFDEAARALGVPEAGELRLGEGEVAVLRGPALVLGEALGALEASCPDAEQFSSVRRRAAELSAALELLTSDEPTNTVRWARRRGRGWLSLHAAPVEIGEALQKTVYAWTKSVVFTSATLAVGSGAERFGYVERRLGVPTARARTLTAPSPFDYQRQAALYVPRALPEPAAPGWTDAFCAEVERLVALTGGRAFVLFTSLRHLDAVHAQLAPRLGVPAWKQGQLPRRALLEAFVTEPSVLFAAQSFWEGVDVPGDALSLVVIDRLPFAPPGEPLLGARIEAARRQGLNPFDALQVPQAALALKQGFGRLIRTATDRGIVSVGDVRLLTKRYGKVFLESLPRSQRFSRFDDVARWWAQGLPSAALAGP